MKKTIPSRKGLVLLVLAVLGFIIFVKVIGNQKEIKFTGTITDINTGCYVDGTCAIKVDDKWIITSKGEGLTEPEAHGYLIGVSLDKKFIGTQVEVYAKEYSDQWYTLYGKSNYFIRVEF